MDLLVVVWYDGKDWGRWQFRDRDRGAARDRGIPEEPATAASVGFSRIHGRA